MGCRELRAIQNDIRLQNLTAPTTRMQSVERVVNGWAKKLFLKKKRSHFHTEFGVLEFEKKGHQPLGKEEGLSRSS